MFEHFIKSLHYFLRCLVALTEYYTVTIKSSEGILENRENNQDCFEDYPALLIYWLVFDVDHIVASEVHSSEIISDICMLL
jgi:hypothetical protein